jgi:hypothetical protein
MLSLVPTTCSFYRVGKAVSDLAVLSSVADELHKNEEQQWNYAYREKPKFWDKKPVPVALRTLIISHGLTWD